MKKQPVKKKNGFTLMEVLVSILILGIGILGTASLLVIVIKTNHLGNQMSIATAAAQASMEKVRQDGFYGTQPAPYTSPSPEAIPGFPSTLTRTFNIQSLGTGVKQVTVTVNFVSFGIHTVELDTILAR